MIRPTERWLCLFDAVVSWYLPIVFTQLEPVLATDLGNHREKGKEFTLC